MDANTLLIVGKIQKNEPIEFRDLVLYLIVIPIMTLILSKFSVVYTAIYDYLVLKWKQLSDFNEVVIEGYETINYASGVQYEYPSVFTALVWKISEYRRKVDLRAYNSQWVKNLPHSTSSSIEFSLDTTRSNWIHIEDDISFKATRIGSSFEDDKFYSKRIVSLILRSRRNDLKKYLEKVLEEYEIFIAQKTFGKLYHFLYTGTKDSKPTFVTKCFSDLVSDPNNETFDHLVNEHSEQFIKDLNRLKDVDYYARTGTSRKKGYLFWGTPGTGKSRTVLAMANYDNRHILEIPISRIKTNEELERLIGIEQINGVKFRSDQIIYLFEEIDTADVSHKREESSDSDSEPDIKSACSELMGDDEKDEKKNRKNKSKTETEPVKTAQLEIIKSEIKKRDVFMDSLNLGVILARLDGIGNYNGMIIVATTNHKDKLDPALYRDQRLTPIHFTYSRKDDMIKMAERFYQEELSEDMKELFPDRSAKITPAKFRTLLETHESVTDLLLELKLLENNEPTS